MRLHRIHYAACITLAIAVNAAHAQEAEPPVAVKTEGMALHVAAKVKAKAAQGITALRRYVHITRGMHQIDLRSIVREEKD
ncbi:MAG TPA: hypothetical protein VLT89_06825 [Usitatibacter sp.]|nr:hypothetical protein [Usitatibacter sp.]